MSLEKSFIEVLMEKVMDGVMIPKYQVERAVAPILDVFIENVISTLLDSKVEVISPEFPILKNRSAGSDSSGCTSTNIDWLMFNWTRNEIIFLELKTTDTTFRDPQSKIYSKIKREIGEGNAGLLVEGVEKIRRASSEFEKYDYILSKLKKFPMQDCSNARIVYIAPESCQILGQVDLRLTFSQLPKHVDTPYPKEWVCVREKLERLDQINLWSRNYRSQSMGQKNFEAKLNCQEVRQLCLDAGDDVVIGFQGGLKALQQTNPTLLLARKYKWDHAVSRSNSKNIRNWIPGSRFLSVVDEMVGGNRDC